MVRAGTVALCSLAGLVGGTGCSLLLDFGPSAVPADAAPPLPYVQAECDFGEPNDTPAEATPLTPADVGPAAICVGDPEDHDFYRFTVPAGTAEVRVKITMSTGTSRDLDLRLWDATGATMLAQSRGVDETELIVCPGASPKCNALAPGDYLFEVFPATGGAINRYDIALTITPM